ncbi:WxL protein peptidoglycan domain-containing protein [Brachybacterium sp. AOP25-B2-12]|uniref:WxL protein peptidoglycan domain-containing protein n=1 Tax=Brachybacterium sp. AOP25-B2-12 TaxID=3457710 RepID=UPI004034E391
MSAPTAHPTARRSPIVRLLHAALIAVMLVLTSGLAAANAEDVTLSIAPGPSDGSTGRGDTLAWFLEPGTTVQDSVVITNYNDTSLQLALGAKDAITTSDGNLDLALADVPDTGIGAWIALPQETVDIPAGQSVTVPFTLTIPADAAPGDHSGGILVSYTTPGASVSVDDRVATRVDVRVAGELTATHEISDLAVEIPSTWSLLTPSTATVTYTLTNTGNARIYANETITASGPLGIGALRTTATLAEVLPGATVQRSVKVDARALLWNRITVDTTSFAVDETPGTAVSLETSVFAAPWTQLIVMVLLLVLAVVLGVRLSGRLGRRTAAPPAATPSPSTPPQADDADDVAPHVPSSAPAPQADDADDVSSPAPDSRALGALGALDALDARDDGDGIPRS